MLVVPSRDNLKNIPPAQGLLAFRPENQQLLVQGKQGWNKIATEKKVRYRNKSNKLFRNFQPFTIQVFFTIVDLKIDKSTGCIKNIPNRNFV